MEQHVIFTNKVDEALHEALHSLNPAKVFVLADEHTAALVLPQLHLNAAPITIAAGDSHKDLSALEDVWNALQREGATRASVLVNVGGGMVTDLGGMAAATFKRGIRFINVPTTLLAAVDAAVGGKTGINHGGLKNELGVFAPASHVIISTAFFGTLPHGELLSGYAEMLKHAILTDDDSLEQLMRLDPTGEPVPLELLRRSVEVKQRIVEQDPHEQGPRKALNLGHTVGHAFESLALRRRQPVPHGYAVAWGLVVESLLSHLRLGFPSATVYRLADFVMERYGTFVITCDDYPWLVETMRHDKKSHHGEINCTLLAACGHPRVDRAVTPDDITTALDLYRDLFHI